MKSSTLSLITAFVSAAFVSLAGAQETKNNGGEDAPADKSTEHAEKKKGHSDPSTQSEFITTAARKGISEVKCAQIALAKSDNAKVRDFAALIVKDHSSANEELKGIAEKLGLSIPTDLDEKVKKKHAELEKKSGKEFDTAFLNGMATTHDKAIELFETGSKVSKDELVLTFIKKTLPRLKEHAAKVKELGGINEGELHTVTENPGKAPSLPPPSAPETPSPNPR